MDCSTPGFPDHHQFPDHIQTHVHRIGEAIQPSHPLLSPSPPAFNLSQHQGLFQYSGLIYFRIDWFDHHAHPKDSQESSPAPQHKSINSSALSLLYGPTLTSIHDCWKNQACTYIDYYTKISWEVQSKNLQ